MSVINTNIKSLVAQGALARNNRDLATAMERLSTGSRINSAADDAAGLSIATRMTSQVRGLQMAIKNAGDAMSVVETAEGASNEISDILQRMRELAVQSASDSNSDDDRAFLNLEVQQLSDEIDRIANTTQFNGINILDGSYANKQFQIGANAGQTVALSVGSMTSNTLGVASSSASVAGSSSSSAVTSGVVSEGTAADATVARMQFNDARFATQVTEDAYGFTLSDGTTTVTVASTTVNFTSQLSRDNFVTVINEAIADAATNSTLNGARSGYASGLGTLDITDAASRDKLMFDVRIGSGSTESVDLYSRLMNTASTKTAVTGTEIQTAIQAELRALYDDNITVTSASATGIFTITDDHGRRLEVSQGAGDGSLFGSDVANDGGLVTPASRSVNLSVAWAADGSDVLEITNEAGGKVILGSFAASAAASTVTWYGGSQAEGVSEPILVGTSASTQRVLDTLKFSGSVQETKIAVSSNAYSTASGVMKFRLQDSSGNELYSAATTTIGNNADNSLSASLRTTILAAISSNIVANFGSDSTYDISEFDVQIDRGTIIFSNSQGRELQIVATGGEALASTDDTLTVTNLNNFTGSEVLYSAATSGSVIGVAGLTSDAARGATYAVTEVSMTMQGDEGQFEFELNGVSLAGGTTAASSSFVTWDSGDDFATSTLKAKLDAMVSKINESHPGDVIDYSVSGKTITFYQLHGGELEISNYKTGTTYPSTRFDVTPAAGQGTATDLYYEGHTVIGTTGTATASGTSAVTTTAQIQFSGDDTYGLTVSNGESSYTLAPAMLDIGNASSVDAFNDALEEALVGSGISSSISSNGALMLSRADGGSIYLTSFSSSNGGTGTWTPGAGQGSATSLPGNGALTSVTSSSSSSVSGSGSSVAQVTVATQSGAESALATIDSALDYVNAERSKLGAIANRLNHTVDNLSNVVAATQASRSRILDTDYAAETAELARAQIIQQAATAMLAQANQQPQTVLALLQ